MNFNETDLFVNNFISSVPGGIFGLLVLIIVWGIVFCIPIMVAIHRGLSRNKIFGVILATIFGFWVIGLVLALVLSPSD